MPKKMVCPECGARIAKSKFLRHMRRYHPEKISPSEKSSDGGLNIRRYLPYIGIAVVVVVVVAVGAVMLSREEPKNETRIALFETTMGNFKVELDTERAPITAGNFIDLVESGFYDGLTFHRVAQDFVIQGGDPSGDGTGGTETIPWENTTLKNRKYTISMARKGNDENSASCQFFINLKDNEGLDDWDPPFVVFGRVTEGFETVDSIGSLVPPGSTDYDGKPTITVEMNVSMVS